MCILKLDLQFLTKIVLVDFSKSEWNRELIASSQMFDKAQNIERHLNIMQPSQPQKKTSL